MDSQKTISQEGDGVRYEKKMENILDCMWYMFPGWDHMLWCSVGNWNNTGRYYAWIPGRNEMGIKSYKIYRHR